MANIVGSMDSPFGDARNRSSLPKEPIPFITEQHPLQEGEPHPICKVCDSPDTIKYGIIANEQRWKCNKCNGVFIDNGYLPKVNNPTSTILKTVELHNNKLPKVGQQTTKLLLPPIKHPKVFLDDEFGKLGEIIYCKECPNGNWGTLSYGIKCSYRRKAQRVQWQAKKQGVEPLIILANRKQSPQEKHEWFITHKEEIINDYKTDGKMAQAKWKLSYHMLSRWNIARPRNRPTHFFKVSEKIDKVIEIYNQGLGIRFVMKETGLSKNTIRKIIKEQTDKGLINPSNIKEKQMIRRNKTRDTIVFSLKALASSAQVFDHTIEILKKHLDTEPQKTILELIGDKKEFSPDDLIDKALEIVVAQQLRLEPDTFKELPNGTFFLKNYKKEENSMEEQKIDPTITQRFDNIDNKLKDMDEVLNLIRPTDISNETKAELIFCFIHTNTNTIDNAKRLLKIIQELEGIN